MSDFRIDVGHMGHLGCEFVGPGNPEISRSKKLPQTGARVALGREDDDGLNTIQGIFVTRPVGDYHAQEDLE